MHWARQDFVSWNTRAMIKTKRMVDFGMDIKWVEYAWINAMVLMKQDRRKELVY